MAVVGLLVLGAGTAAIVLRSGPDGGNDQPATMSDAAFWGAVNSEFRELASANLQAQSDIAQTPATGTEDQLYADAQTIVSAADSAAARLRSLPNLSTSQAAQRDSLLTFVNSNRLYGSTMQQYALRLVDFQAIATAAAAAALVRQQAASGLPTLAELPSSSVFMLAAPEREPAVEPTPTTEPAPAPGPTSGQPEISASQYVAQIDGLLRGSQQTRQEVIAFVPRVMGGRIGASSAVEQAEQFTADRQQALKLVRELRPPSQFNRVHNLLVQSLLLSIADDRALVSWAKARTAGGSGTAELNRVNEVGAQASEAKRRFLALYGQQRAAATGQPPSSLPDGY